MRIQSNDLSAEVLTDLALAIGQDMGYTDNQRNPRAATPSEVRDWIFDPAKRLYLDFVTKRALQANPPQVTPIDL